MKWILLLVCILIVLIAMIYLIGSLMDVKHVATIERKLKMGSDETWIVLTNYKEYTSWRNGIKELTIDSTNHWTEKNSHGDNVSYQLEVVDDKRTFITRIINKDLAYGGYWEFSISPLQDGCLVKITENGEVFNPIFRFMAKYFFGHETTLKNYMRDLEVKSKSPSSE